MPRPAFTMIEVLAVVALLGILAAATTWSLASDARRVSRDNVMDQLANADQVARVAARRSGQRCVLEFDLDTQTVRRVGFDQYDQRQAAHSLKLPADCRIAQVLLADSRVRSSGALRQTVAVQTDWGRVAIPVSSTGRSPTYAVQVKAGDEAEGQWLMCSGLTGQVSVVEHEADLDRLFALLATGRPDAD